MAFVQAKWFYRGRRANPRLIVIHCTVSPDMGTGAEAVAAYFARGDRRASAHRVADANSVVTCVRDEDTAFGAAGANTDGLHLELVGMPNQTRDEWLDDFGLAMFAQARAVLDEWSARYDIPLRWLTVSEVRGGAVMGVTTHVDVEAAFPSTGHYDPGPHFPRDVFLAAAPLPQEDDMAVQIDTVKDEKGRVWVVHRGPAKDCIVTIEGKHWSQGGAFSSDFDVEPHEGGIIVAGVGLDLLTVFANHLTSPTESTGWFPLG